MNETEIILAIKKETQLWLV